MQTKIALVGIPDDYPTAYISGGATRDRGGNVPPDGQTRTVARAGGGGVWRGTRGLVAALERLQADVVNAGGSPLRLTEVYRDQQVQADARARFERWVRAGKPHASSSRFDRTTMKSAYVARPGHSNHGWGGAVDFDVAALEFPGTGRGTNDALAVLWRMAKKHGFTPIIGEPVINQSESWHFDHWGPLAAVRNMFVDNGSSAYGPTALVGCILAGTLPISVGRGTERYVQARLLAGGHWVGEAGCDGHLGNATKHALRAAGIDLVPGAVATTGLIAALDAAEVGFDLLRET